MRIEFFFFKVLFIFPFSDREKGPSFPIPQGLKHGSSACVVRVAGARRGRRESRCVYSCRAGGGGFFFSSRAATGLAGEGLHEAAALVGEDDGVGRMEGCFRAALFFLQLP